MLLVVELPAALGCFFLIEIVRKYALIRLLVPTEVRKLTVEILKI